MSLLVAQSVTLEKRLHATDLRLDAGTLTCLIGPNGSGKTSLLHALAGIGAGEGMVLVDGIDPRMLGPGQRRRWLGFLPASRDIKWPLAARDLIALGGEGDVESLLADLELGDMAHRRVDQLSTGERSRVLIARALVSRPKLLLLDEPVANLDPLWQLKLMDHLRRLVRGNEQAALVAMHDLELARLYADRLIIMQQGRIVAEGDPEELLSGPHIPAVFGIEREGSGWRLRPPAGPRSSP